ncbi:hypothetical protein F5883DRAFT_702076 [Diaporthe sp. PMI_573]|nr:hypothetical protein F5883DRAFT_702076 [Diaporthaceae sp. PMI_573]
MDRDPPSSSKGTWNSFQAMCWTLFGVTQFLPLEKETTDKLLKLGFIERCMRTDAAPVLFVPTPHSSDRRFCIDYRWRNQFLKNRLVPAPDLNGTVFNCRNARRFSKIDIIQAFDINNPVKMRLSIHRLHEHDTAKELLADLRGRTGQESVFGKISHYYATVETNDRGSLHLHGLLWLEGNMQLPSLIDDMAKPEEEEYRAQVVRYLDSVFHECLDEEAGKAVRKERKPIDPVEEIMHDAEALAAVFDKESNHIAYCCQVHSHTYTCIKYSLKGLVGEGVHKHKRTACRFKAPWKIVEESGFTEDGLLKIRRNHPLVNRYNKAMAVGLRHNHDISMILTRTKGLAMVFYITNYATKLDTPMWKRLVFAADVLRQLLESAALRNLVPNLAEQDAQRQAVVNESRQFLMRAANRIFSERQLSAVHIDIEREDVHARDRDKAKVRDPNNST